MSTNKIFHATIMPDSDWWNALWPDPETVLKQAGVETGMDVVDLCCGNGLFSQPICRLIESGNLFALDLDETLLEQAETVCTEAGNNNVNFILASALDLSDHLSENVDMVFIANTFHGVPDKAALSATVNSVLKDSGTFVVVNWHKLPREKTVVLDQPRGPDSELRMSPEDVKKKVEPAGFTLDKVIDVGPFHYAAIFVKNILDERL